jgi:hypothetical protein
MRRRHACPNTRHRRRASVRTAVATLLVGSASLTSLAGCGSSSATTAQLDADRTCASIYPSPGTRFAPTTTQISVRGMNPRSLSSTTVTIIGATTGLHTGRWVADSDGQGASFYPSKPFAAGEAVRVTLGVAVCGSKTTSVDNFRIAHRPGPLAPAPPKTHATAQAALDQPTLTFASAPGLAVPKLDVHVAARFGGDYVFEAPFGGTKPAGPMIVDGRGNLVWFHPLPKGATATDFRTQTYHGEPVLTWWEGGINFTNGEATRGQFVIMDSHYRIIKTITVGNGIGTDEHEFLLTNDGADAWVIGAHVAGVNLKAIGGSRNGAVIDQIAQRIDVATGNVTFAWHSLDHVPVSDSYQGFAPSVDYDYFHMNSIDPVGADTVVVSSRHTHAAYVLNTHTGAVRWRVGGKHSSFAMGPGAAFALQHDVRVHGTDTVTIFDDEDASPTNAPARAITLHLDTAHKRATLIRSLTHKGLKVFAMGNVQVLGNGDTMVGWGTGSTTSVFSPTGALLFDATFGTSIFSYRAYLAPWVGAPTTTPSIAATRTTSGVSVFASWNGDTRTTRWVIRGGPSATQLTNLGSAARAGFQTTIRVQSHPHVVEVAAEDASGHILGVSSEVTPSAGAVASVTTHS